MSVDAIAGLSGGFTSAAAQAKAKSDASAEEREQLLAEIREKGFVAYVEEMQKEKIEEMRRKILESMGITEEDLAKMSADQRAAVEDAVSQEIQRRLEASHMAGNEEASESTENGTSDSGLQPGFARLDTSLLQVLQEDRTDWAPDQEERAA